MRASRPPTDRQTQVLRFIADYSAEHGYPPTHREVGDGLGFIGLNAVHDHIKCLVRKGMVTRTPMVSRGLVLTERGKAFLQSAGQVPASANEGS